MNRNAEDRRPIVLLDLDNTILDFNKAERRALDRALTSQGLPFNDEIAALYHQSNIRHWEMLEDGILTRAEVLVQRYDEVAIAPLDIKEFFETFDSHMVVWSCLSECLVCE